MLISAPREKIACKELKYSLLSSHVKLPRSTTEAAFLERLSYLSNTLPENSQAGAVDQQPLPAILVQFSMTKMRLLQQSGFELLSEFPPLVYHFMDNAL